MNKPNAIMMGWNRVVAGRESLAAELYGTIVGFLSKAQQDQKIEGFQRTILASHGGDMNGFFFVTGDPDKLHALRTEEAFYNIVLESNTVLQGFGVVEAYANDTSDNVLKDWGTRVLPKLR